MAAICKGDFFSFRVLINKQNCAHGQQFYKVAFCALCDVTKGADD